MSEESNKPRNEGWYERAKKHRSTIQPDAHTGRLDEWEHSADTFFGSGSVCGHAGKPYYETTDGVGTLLCALLELAQSS